MEGAVCRPPKCNLQDIWIVPVIELARCEYIQCRETSSSSAATTLGPSHSGLVRQAVADLRGCHRSGAPPPVAGVGGFFTVRRRP